MSVKIQILTPGQIRDVSMEVRLYDFSSPPPSPWRCGPTRAMVSSFLRFLDHIKRRITVGRTPLDARSVRRRDLYLTTHNTHNKRLCPRWDSNPQSQQASGRRPTPYTARPLGPALSLVTLTLITI